jgi:hypothetical protein
MELMGMGSMASTTFADRAVEQLRDWPSLRICLADTGPGRGVALSTRQIVHLHSDAEAEVRLTWPVVHRMAEVLIECGRVTIRPGDDWVQVRLDSDSDVRLFASLVSVAIKANVQALAEPDRPVTSCPQAA